MIEDVKKITQRGVAGTQLFQDCCCVPLRQRSLRTGQAHEVDSQKRSLTFLPLK